MKRFLEFLLVALTLPVWLTVSLCVALLIACTMGFPVIFRQERAGKGGRPFRLMKFRTMRSGEGTDAERTTRVGRILRATSLDELPQLFHVLSGRMSLVGPRPLPVRYLPRYSAEQARRHEVRPGITGWAQVNGRNAISWERKFAYDVWYVDHRSLALDIRILWRTIFKTAARTGINATATETMGEFLPDGAPQGIGNYLAIACAALGAAAFAYPFEVPKELVAEWVTPDRVIDEEADDWRPVFESTFRPLVAECKTPTEAVQKINSVIWDKLDVHYSTQRDKANQSPFHSMRIHKASCTGMAIIQVCAYRSVGIPARLVGCNWTTLPGNHSWPEFWDGGWHHFGDGDPSPIDKSWVDAFAAEADASSPQTRIYASRATPNSERTRFWRTWAWPQGWSDVWADDVTETYRKYKKTGTSAADVPRDTNYVHPTRRPLQSMP